MLSQKYIELREIALQTLKDFEYETEGFDTLRKVPFPIMRYAIAFHLYNTPGSSLEKVGKVLHRDHSTLTYGLQYYYDVMHYSYHPIEKKLVSEFNRRVGKIDESVKTDLDYLFDLQS